MTTISQILTRAQALAEVDPERSCAHIAIGDAAYDGVSCGPWDVADQRALKSLLVYAAANCLAAPTLGDCSSIHRYWDAATPEERAASWVRARAMVGEG